MTHHVLLSILYYNCLDFIITLNLPQVETRITARLRDQLGAAKNANEMFRIFSRFNALFVRQRIRGAIREYQTQLIQRVKVQNFYRVSQFIGLYNFVV